jgi:hypothetical protein
VVARDSFRFCSTAQFQAIAFDILPGALTCDLRPFDLIGGAWTFAGIGFYALPTARPFAESDPRGPIPRRFVVANPEPGSILIWTSLGLTWAGKKWWRRGKAKKASATTGESRARGRNSRTKQPWPEHVRFAILDIIDQGRSNRSGRA